MTLVSVVVGAGSLAGCSSNEETEPQAQQRERPEKQQQAQQKSAKPEPGAESTPESPSEHRDLPEKLDKPYVRVALDYYDAWHAALDSGDTDSFMQYATDDCRGCKGMRNLIERTLAKGGSLRRDGMDPVLDSKLTRVMPSGDEDRKMLMLHYRQGKFEKVPEAGAKPERSGPRETVEQLSLVRERMANVDRQAQTTRSRGSMIRMQRTLVVAAAMLLALVGIGQVDAGPAHAKEGKCLKKDDSGACILYDLDDLTTPAPPEPKEGDTDTQERWRDGKCFDPIQGVITKCSNLDPCEEGEGYEHRRIEYRDVVYRNGAWRPTSDWYDDVPSTKCVNVDGQVTERQVRSALREFGMKSGNVRAAPPGGKTLVNFDTIVWTGQGSYEFRLDVLDTPVRLAAAPAAYHWDFGDGDTASFDTPGVSYAKGRPMSRYHTHTYQETGNYDVSLTIEYQVQWNAGNGWQPLTGTLSSDPNGYSLEVVQKQDRLSNGR